MARWISFRFDDGFIDGARKAADILHPHAATFFIITGLVTGAVQLDHLDHFADADFGTVESWKALAARGQDIQSHGVDHASFATLDHDQALDQIRVSLDTVREINPGPHVFCFPYNAVPDLDLAGSGLSAAGFATVDSQQDVLSNRLAGLDPLRLRSWAVRERHLDFVVQQLADAPDDTWTILAFHSLDGQGHEPWTSEGFADLVAAVLRAGYQVTTLGDMVTRLEAAQDAVD